MSRDYYSEATSDNGFSPSGNWAWRGASCRMLRGALWVKRLLLIFLIVLSIVTFVKCLYFAIPTVAYDIETHGRQSVAEIVRYLKQTAPQALQ